MAILSTEVTAGMTALASQYNNLRTDLLTGDITIAGIKTFSSNAIFSAGIKIAESQKLYFNTAQTTYLYGNANQLIMYVNGSMIFQSHSTYFNPAVDVVLESTKKLFFDGGGDSFIHHPSANFCEWRVGGVVPVWVSSSATYGVGAPYGFGVYSGKKLYFDDGGDTYDIESSANVRDMYVGGARILRLDSSGISLTLNHHIILEQSVAGGDCSISWGGGDYIVKKALNDRYEFYINSARVGYVDSSGFHNG